MTSFGADTVCAREALWLASPPGMVKANVADTTGAFDVVQAYIARDQGGRRGVYVTRASTDVRKWNSQRSIARHSMVVRVKWPLLDAGGSAETDQQAFDAALELLTEQIAGPVTDKTHGGQFQYAAVSQLGGSTELTVKVADAELAIAHGQPLTATITYLIDDHEVLA